MCMYVAAGMYVHTVFAQKIIILISLVEKYLFKCIPFLTISFINLRTIRESHHLTPYCCDPT